MKKELIYIANISYFREGATVPLSAGYISAFTQAVYPERFEIKIFNDPEALEYSIKQAPPRILGLSNYCWNRNINTQFIKYTKHVSPGTITVLGGPCFAKNDSEWLDKFFRSNQGLDFYVSGEGESKFAELLKVCFKNDYDINSIKSDMPTGVFCINADLTVREGTRKCIHTDGYHKDLDEIPSPYLTGMLDSFLDKGFVPLLETVRGCPYSCTFCCWGDASLNRLTAFSVERVKAELEYIVARTKHRRLIITDGNFGILKRDLEISRHIRDISDKSGWPKDIYLYFAKNADERIIDITRILGNLVKVSLSRQSLNKDVLRNIKRSNIDKETFSRIKACLKQDNIESMIEVIYPLPGETRSTFVNGLSRIFSEIDPKNTEIRIYPAELLSGSEMDTAEYRKRYDMRSAWRPMDDAFNRKFKYVDSCEYQEIIVSTDSFSVDDFFYVRKLHFFICLFFTYKIYWKVFDFYKSLGFAKDFIWFIDRIIKGIDAEGGAIKEIFDEFDRAIRDELIDDKKYWSDAGYQRYQDTRIKRINIYYILKLLYGANRKYYMGFMDLIRKAFVGVSKIDPVKTKDILDSIGYSIVDFTKIESWLKEGVLENNKVNIPHERFVIDEFERHYNGDLVDTLDRIYYTTYPGDLGRLVLANSEVTINA